MKTIFTLPGNFDITLAQNSAGKFRVTYGLQVNNGLNYARAAQLLGEAILHALACDGMLDNSERACRDDRL